MRLLRVAICCLFAAGMALATRPGAVSAQQKSLADITAWITDTMHDQSSKTMHYRSSNQVQVNMRSGGTVSHEYVEEVNQGTVTVRLDSFDFGGCTGNASWTDDTDGVEKTQGYDPDGVQHSEKTVLSFPLGSLSQISLSEYHVTPYMVVEGYSCDGNCNVPGLKMRTNSGAFSGTSNGHAVSWNEFTLPVFSSDAAPRLLHAFQDAAVACGAAPPKQDLY